MIARLLFSSFAFAFAFVPLAAALSVGGCSTTDGAGAAGAGDGGSADEEAAAAASGGDAATTAASDGAAPDPSPVRFVIQLDYRYDKAGFFADPVRRQALEGACRIWGRLLSDHFASVPQGTYIKVRDPEKPTEPAVALEIEYEIDDLVVFVGSASLPAGVTGISSPTAGLSGVTDGALATSLQARFDGQPFQPWTAWISFDSRTDFFFDPHPELGSPVPAGMLDFVSVALHEIGHTLGFGTAAAFKTKISGGTFVGSNAQALHGGPLPLANDLGHVPNTTMSGGHRMLMDVSDSPGTRYLPTALDKAVLQDLGLHF
jgi:hypothetical protein